MSSAARAGSRRFRPGGSGIGRPLLTANVGDRLVDNFDDKWIDVGFWIRPDGRVEALEIVRRRGGASWAEPLLRSIRGRRYAASDGASTYRLERYTYTSGYNEYGSGTRTATRSPRARVEYFDLSASTAPCRQRPRRRLRSGAATIADAGSAPPDHQVADLGHVLHREADAFAAEAAILDPAIGHVVDAVARARR